MCSLQEFIHIAFTRVGWQVHSLTDDATVEFDQILFIFQHSLPCSPHTSSIGVAALGFLWYRNSHPDPQESPQLQIWPHHRSDTASIAGAWSRWNNTPFVRFPGRSRNVSSTTVFSKFWITLSSVSLFGRKCISLSGKIEFSACQVSLLWHNFFVDLWTFQPTLVES